MLGVPSCLVSASSLCRQADQAGGHEEGGSRWTDFLFDHARARGEPSCPFQAAQVRLLVLGLLSGCDSEPVDELEEFRLGCSLVPQCPFLKSIVVGHGVLPLEPFPGSCVYSIIACHCGFSLPGSMSMLRLDELSRNLDSVRVGSACFIATEVRPAANVSAIHPVLTSGPCLLAVHHCVPHEQAEEFRGHLVAAPCGFPRPRSHSPLTRPTYSAGSAKRSLKFLSSRVLFRPLLLEIKIIP